MRLKDSDYLSEKFILFFLLLFIFSVKSLCTNFEYGVELLKNNQLDSALEIFLALEKENPDDYGVINNIGVVFFEKTQYNLAWNYFEKAKNLNPEYKNAYINLGLIHFYNSDWNRLINLVRETIRVFPEDFDSLILLESYARYRLRDFRKAKELFLMLDSGNIDSELQDLYSNLEKKIKLL